MRSGRSGRSGRGMAVVLALLLSALSAGCQSDEGDRSGSDDASSTSSGSPTGRPTIHASDPSPTTESPLPDWAATGPRFGPEGVKLNAPEGWTEALGETATTGSRTNPSTLDGVSVYVHDFALDPRDVDALARDEIAGSDGRYRRLPDEKVDGERVYHLAGPSSSGVTWDEAFGTRVGTRAITIEFYLETVPKQRRDRLIDSVLATVAWE